MTMQDCIESPTPGCGRQSSKPYFSVKNGSNLGLCWEFKRKGSLYIAQLDIERDVVLLRSPDESDLPSSTGLEASQDVASAGPAYVRGYPYSIYTQLRSDLTVRKPTTEYLRTLISGNILSSLDNRKSPDPDMPVLSLEGNLVPGHSGAPIFNSSNQVIGVANGGLQGGTTGIVWAIPWRDITWMPLGRVREQELTLEQSDPGLLFSFLIPDPKEGSISVSGLVIDGENQAPLANALSTLYVFDGNKPEFRYDTMPTDDNGKFLFRLPSSYSEFSGRIYVERDGYRNYRHIITQLGDLVPYT